MPRVFRIVATAVGALLLVIVGGWCVAFLLAGWLHSMMMDDPVRQLWQPRIDHGMHYFVWIVLAAWLVLFSVCWRLTNGFRGPRHI